MRQTLGDAAISYQQEYETLKSDASITNLNTAAASALAFTSPGTRLHNGTSFTNQTTIGYYWTSATYSTHSILFSFGSTWAGSNDNYRAIGYSVRCIQD